MEWQDGGITLGNMVKERDATIASLTARVAELEIIHCLVHKGESTDEQPCPCCAAMAIADLTAQLSAMTQERDAHGAQREEVEKRLMDCQYKLADVTAKLAAKSAQLNDLLNDVVDVAQAEMRAVTAETALREAREALEQLIPWAAAYRVGPESSDKLYEVETTNKRYREAGKRGAK